MKRVILAALLGFLIAPPALACAAAPWTVHLSEIALLDRGIDSFQRAPALIARVKELRDKADAAFKARNYSDAEKNRRAALIAIGYAIGARPRVHFRGCGGGSNWVATAQ